MCMFFNGNLFCSRSLITTLKGNKHILFQVCVLQIEQVFGPGEPHWIQNLFEVVFVLFYKFSFAMYLLHLYRLWQYGLWSFQTGYTNLERFLQKNQHTQRKLLNFENWTNGEPQQLAKIRVFNVDYFDFSCKKIE